MVVLTRHVLLAALQLFDVFVVCAAMLVAVLGYSGRSSVTITDVLAMRMTVANFVLVSLFLVMVHWTFSYQGLYQSRRLSRRVDEAFDLVVAVLICTTAMLLGSLVFRIDLITGDFLALFGVSALSMLFVSRLILRAFLARIRGMGRNLRNVLIVGTNERAVRFARTIDVKPDLGYTLLGFADEPWPGMARVRNSGYSIVSNLEALGDYLRQSVVDEVVIALPLKSSYERMSQVIRICEEQGIVVRLISGMFDLRTARTRAEPFENETVVSVYTGRMLGWPVLLKRLLDTVLAAFLIALMSPLFLIAALLIKIASPGPVMFAQERVGIGKRRFKLYKFRTMVVDAERRMAALEKLNEVSGPVFKISNDPRVTPIGRLLRKASIDELPQLFNVLKGDMSLVGPRPLPVRDYNGFDADWHRRRFSVRPGITCLWQVNGRSKIGFDEWMKLDMEYIDRWSLWLDLKILLKTVPAVLRGSGAA